MSSRSRAFSRLQVMVMSSRCSQGRVTRALAGDSRYDLRDIGSTSILN